MQGFTTSEFEKLDGMRVSFDITFYIISVYTSVSDLC